MFQICTFCQYLFSRFIPLIVIPSTISPHSAEEQLTLGLARPAPLMGLQILVLAEW
jgi:hypothetical protein